MTSCLQEARQREKRREVEKEEGKEEFVFLLLFLYVYFDFYTPTVVSNWLPQTQYAPEFQIKSELRSNPLSALKSTHCQIPQNNRVLFSKVVSHHPSPQSSPAFVVVSIC